MFTIKQLHQIRQKIYELNNFSMIKNYFKTAFRNLVRNKNYTIINIAGLAIGIASCLLIFLIIHFETSFDNFHKNKDRIYRIVTASQTPQGTNYEAGVPFPTAAALRLDYPQLKQVADIIGVFGTQITVINNDKTASVKKFKEKNGLYFAEPQLFKIFNFQWLAGDPNTALSEPNTVVLTQNAAEKYFGNWQNAIGKSIEYENKNILKVTGILKNPPANTDIPLNIVISYTTLQNTDMKGNLNDWTSIYGLNYCFAVLPDKMTESQLNADLAVFVKKHKPAEYAKRGMIAQPLSDMHYDSRFSLFSNRTFSKELITALSIVGIFLLIIACVNFINLATAQAINRSKEVGIRKVLGSNRKQLIFQFLCETFLITIFAFLLAVIIAEAALPFLNQLLEVKLNANFLDPVVVVFLLATIVTVTLLSGFYPAFIIANYNSISALKNKVASATSGEISLRRGLVVFQFCIAQILVIGALVIISQMNYFKNAPLGFDKNAIISVPLPTDSISQTKYNALRDQLLQQPDIKNVTFSFSSPSDNSSWGSDFKYNNAPKKSDFTANLKWADADYFKTYDLKFVAGRPYTKSDTVHEYVVNETFLKKLGVNDPQQAIGKYINLWDDKTKTAQIVGVVKDFNVASLRKEIPPVIMSSWKDVYQKVDIKLEPGDIKQSLASVEKLWNKTFPEYVYDYQFIDDRIADFYKREDQLSQLYKIFAGIAIFISCLGLYGLVSFMAVQRTKEVGIRKTLGASVTNIVYLFSKEFTILVVIAFAISAPIGWYFMNNWLRDFSYRITLGPEIFLLTIILSIAIAWITVGYKAIAAALANPVKSLRTE